MIVAISLPAILVGFSADLLLLAQGGGMELVRAYAGLLQGLFGCVSAALAQGQVVFGGATIVAVALNAHLPVGMRLDDFRRAGQGLLRFGAEVGLVIIEVDVFDGLVKELFFGKVRRRRGCGRWRRLGDGHLRRGVLRAASTFRGEVIGGGLRG